MAERKYRLLVIDIDGTLINAYGDISQANREALALARSSGVLVSISTGRSLRSSLAIIDQLSLDSFHIFFDGALVCHPSLGDEIFSRFINETTLKQMIEFAHGHGIDLELYSKAHYFAERETWSTEAHRRFFNVEPVITDFDRLHGQEKIIKGAIVVTTPEEEAKASGFCQHFSDQLHFTHVRIPGYPGVIFINILAPGTSKGTALKTLTSHLGISLAEVAAVGDGQNDISLLSTAGLGIAMGNAHDELKKIAHHVTFDVEQDGLAAAVRRFLI